MNGPRSRDPLALLAFCSGWLMARWLSLWIERRDEARRIDRVFERIARDLKAQEGTTEFLRNIKGGEGG